MGNHLAATASVNVSDISSSLQLISPLSCNGQNCFTTFHCWRYTHEQTVEERWSMQHISPHMLRPYANYYLLCSSNKRNTNTYPNTNGGSSNTDKLNRASRYTECCTNECESVNEENDSEFSVNDSIADKKKTYVEQLLEFRRKLEKRRLEEVSKHDVLASLSDLTKFAYELYSYKNTEFARKTALHVYSFNVNNSDEDNCACSQNHNDECNNVKSDNKAKVNLPAATSSPKEELYLNHSSSNTNSEETLQPSANSIVNTNEQRKQIESEVLEQEQNEPWKEKELVKEFNLSTPALTTNLNFDRRKEINLCSADSLPCRLFLTSQTRKIGVVSKVFVYSVNDSAESLSRVRKLHELMKAMQHKMKLTNTHNSNHKKIRCSNNNCNNNGDINNKNGILPQHNLFYTVMDSSNTRFALLERPYIAFSFTERLFTHPYWTRQERWFTCFQLLFAVAQLHDVYHCVHGDIKPNNVLVQSTGWLYLTDAAPFKPAIMPADNPALFDYFYNTDETHICCCAPEKFAPITSSEHFYEYVKENSELYTYYVEEHEYEYEEEYYEPKSEEFAHNEKILLKSSSSSSKIATPVGKAVSVNGKCNIAIDNINYYYHSRAMDIFSTGCVMAYVLTGYPLLRLSDVLELRDAAHATERMKQIHGTLEEHHLSSAEIDLIMSMLSPVPHDRPSARELLSRFRPLLFPSYFSVLHQSVLPQLLYFSCVDDQLIWLHSSLSSIVDTCTLSTVIPFFQSRVKQESNLKFKKLENNITHATSHFDHNKACCTSHVLHLLLPFIFHALRHAWRTEAVYRGILCLQHWHSKCDLSTQINVLLPEMLYIINAPNEFDVHSRVVALRVACAIAVAMCQYVEFMLWHKRESNSSEEIEEELELELEEKICKCEQLREKRKCDLQYLHEEGVANNTYRVNEPNSSVNIQTCLLLFDNFYFPCIVELVRNAYKETSEIVLVELAEQLPRLLILARYCLVQTFNINSNNSNYNENSNNNNNNSSIYVRECNEERCKLLNIGWDILQALFRHPNDTVCISLLLHSVQIAAFLGNERTAHDLMPLYTTLITRSTPVQRILYKSAITLHIYMAHPQFTTLHFFVEEGLRQGDVECQHATLCALAAVIRTNAQFTNSLFTSSDIMRLVHSTLPYLLSANNILSSAAINIIEVVMQSYSLSVIKEHLSWALQPFLIRAIPLRYFHHLASLALRPELRELVPVTPTNTTNNNPYLLTFATRIAKNEDAAEMWLRIANKSNTVSTRSMLNEAKEHKQQLLQVLTTEASVITTTSTSHLSLEEKEWEEIVKMMHTHYNLNYYNNLWCGLRRSLYSTTSGRLQLREEHLQASVKEECKAQSNSNSNISNNNNNNNLFILNWKKKVEKECNRRAYSRIEICKLDEKSISSNKQVSHLQQTERLPTISTVHTASSSFVSSSSYYYYEEEYKKKNNNSTNNSHEEWQGKPTRYSQQYIKPFNKPRNTHCNLSALHTYYEYANGVLLEPSATPLHTRASHMGAIYSLCTLASGYVLSAGACHEGFVWQTKSHELHNVLRLRLPHHNNLSGSQSQASKDAFTCSQLLQSSFSSSSSFSLQHNTTSSTSSVVALGSTSGFVYLWDVAHNEYVREIDVSASEEQSHHDSIVAANDERNNRWNKSSTHSLSHHTSSVVTSLALHTPQVLLCTTSWGELHAIDTRVDSRHSHWSSTLDASAGVPSCCLPLYTNSSGGGGEGCYGVVVSTLGGAACLYDLRFQRCVQSYFLPSHEENALWCVQNCDGLRWDQDMAIHAYTSATNASKCNKDKWRWESCRSAITSSVLYHTTDMASSSTIQLSPSSFQSNWEWNSSNNNNSPVCLLAANDGIVYRLELESGLITRKLITSSNYYNHYNVRREVSETKQTNSSGSYHTCHNMHHNISRESEQNHAVIHCMISVILPNEQLIFTAGADRYVRSWSLTNPSHSHCLHRYPYSYSTFSSTQCTHTSYEANRSAHTAVNFSDSDNHNNNTTHSSLSSLTSSSLLTIFESDVNDVAITQTKDVTNNTVSYWKSKLPLPIPTHQTDEILALSITHDTNSNEPLLMSAARDGSLVMWANHPANC